jgi:hypothetical protein
VELRLALPPEGNIVTMKLCGRTACDCLPDKTLALEIAASSNAIVLLPPGSRQDFPVAGIVAPTGSR